jgi:protein TonB
MYGCLKQDNRISFQTCGFLMALLLSALSHAVAITLIDPGVSPAPVPAPLQLAIVATPAPATVTPTASVDPVPQPATPAGQTSKQVPQVVEKPPVQRPTPRPSRAAIPVPVARETPPATLDNPGDARPSPPAAPVSSVPATAPVPVSREVEYLYNPSPAYPSRARRMGMEGEVLIRTRILLSGSCDELELVRSSGFEVLDQAAMEAIRRWRFRPASRGDELIISRVEIPVVFRLER